MRFPPKKTKKFTYQICVLIEPILKSKQIHHPCKWQFVLNFTKYIQSVCTVYTFIIQIIHFCSGSMYD